MKVAINKDSCIGCGACTFIADNILQIGDDGLAEVINGKNEVPENEKENVIDAAESCPTGAVEVSEEDE